MANMQLGSVIRHVKSIADRYSDQDPNDVDLLQSFADHSDPRVFEAIMARHGPMVLRVCRRLLGNSHDAEDVFQATFLILAQKAASIRKRASLASWLHGVAFRMANKLKRAAVRRYTHEAKASPARTADPVLTAAGKELQALLDEAIASLPEAHRGPFIACCLENKCCTEAARQLGIKETTLRTRLSRPGGRCPRGWRDLSRGATLPQKSSPSGGQPDRRRPTSSSQPSFFSNSFPRIRS
jgi:RNA polymerase sigma factor (sigma-70 family)